MNTKITPIDKEWVSWWMECVEHWTRKKQRGNNNNSTRLNFTVQFLCELFVSQQSGSNSAEQNFRNHGNSLSLCISSLLFFLQLFYRSYFFFFFFFCVSKVIKMCWKKITMKNLSIYIFLWLSMSESFFFAQRKQHDSKRADECSNWRLYGKMREKRRWSWRKVYIYIFFLFFFYFPFNLGICQAMCSIPFTSRLGNNNVLSRKLLLLACSHANVVRCSFLRLYCAMWRLLTIKRKRNGTQFEVKMWKHEKQFSKLGAIDYQQNYTIHGCQCFVCTVHWRRRWWWFWNMNCE